MASIVKNKKQYYQKYYNTIKCKLTFYKEREVFLYNKEDDTICCYSNSDKYFSKTRKKLPPFGKKISYLVTTFSYNIYTPINKKIFTPDGLLVCMKPSISEDEIEQKIKQTTKFSSVSVSSPNQPLSLHNQIIRHQSTYHTNHDVRMYKSIINFVNILGFKNTRKIIKIIDNGEFSYNNEFINGILFKMQNSRFNVSVHEFILNFTTIKWINFIKFLLNDEEC